MRTTLALIVMLAAVGPGRAPIQSSSGEELPAVFMGSVQAIVPPDGAGAWALQVISRGGLTGRGAGDLVIVSDGRVNRTGRGTLSTELRPDVLSKLNQTILGISPSRWTIGSRLGSCNDCIATLIVLTLREADGTLRTHTAFWDATTRARVPADVLQIHDVAAGSWQYTAGTRQ